MKALYMTLRRPNDRHALSVRYHWNVLWAENLRNALVVERYGYAGDKAYCWAINPDELAHFMAKRLDRCRYNAASGDVLNVEGVEVIDASQLPLMMSKWTVNNDWKGDTKRAWEASIFRFKNMPATSVSSDSNEIVHKMVATLVGDESVTASLVTREACSELQLENWGVW